MPDTGPVKPERHHSVCPHDCPSTCALAVERLDARTIGRVYGDPDNAYTAGVICAKVARYAERTHHPDRLKVPLRRSGPKGSGRFEAISWEQALDTVAEACLRAEQKHGSQAVWPYFYAGTMGLVQRDGINRLRHAKKYSGFFQTICVNLAWPGFIAGTGALRGSDPREMAESDLVVIWGTNAAATQVNVMHHATRARKERGAKIVVIDPYRNATAETADLHLMLRPGTDGALACGVMHVLFKEGFADRAYMARYTDVPDELERHLESRTPAWAAAITGLPVQEILDFARLYGRTKRSFLRLGYGFTRSRNGAVNMHAASCLAAVTGAWQHRGGGAFHNNGAIYHWNKTMIEGLDVVDPSIRLLDQSRVGAVLTGDRRDLGDGPPVTAMLIQNTNPMVVCPDQNVVRAGFSREDLFTCVHEQFLTETALMADIVLPATTFLEHDDLYQGGGHQYIQIGRKLIEPVGEARENHYVIRELARRVGASHPGFAMTAWELIDWTLKASGWPDAATLAAGKWHDCQPDFEHTHYLNGFKHPDGKFRFAPNWSRVGKQAAGMPRLPDHWEVIETATDEHPFRLVTAPARNYLNSSFTETPTSIAREARPTVMIHPEDAGALGIVEGGLARLGNRRGSVLLHARLFDGVQRGVIVSESVWPNRAFIEGKGINTLTGADSPSPNGGAAFHDIAVWVRGENAPAARAAAEQIPA
ncbi:MAG: molybdopterin oxidoreductase family protein [Alphaproteobacteria bacterium]|nr:molybdopterin oxidoreductase family protein [Alphaproteobacteria bacterium]